MTFSVHHCMLVKTLPGSCLSDTILASQQGRYEETKAEPAVNRRTRSKVQVPGLRSKMLKKENQSREEGAPNPGPYCEETRSQKAVRNPFLRTHNKMEAEDKPS
ncbi:hypothetical protein A6R68_11014 [Neotoma lepida]|uniref:Uncharacterized protein n=1 Tax=Neotoma lepida TaxID=56216 RepID=A0A1A6FV70_NEOLE|nr:hypothetical protein A6R68_11014 [Neotoma lepida]